MGQNPGIQRGRILARLRTRGMSRFCKTRRPKLRILMLDSTGPCVFLSTVASSVIPGLYLDFWQRGRLACGNIGCDRRLYRLSSRNPEAGWTLVKEPVAWDLPVYLFDSKSSSSGRLSLIASIGMLHIPPSVDRLLMNFSEEIAEPRGESFFQMVDQGLDEYFQVLDLFEGDLVGFGTLILYFNGRQDLLSGLVTHDLGGMEIFVEAWRLLLLEDQEIYP
ncbi:hypothetical protein Bca52824_048003 [Brassica carinata]|uniref:Uncharacterized protein n=1 Tax=Brassica carinata TaxID=52824 RepID=A0A8X7RMW2_BRACI|nr:hypothetical protein Bca52824_048003 [Brassica carinata]